MHFKNTFLLVCVYSTFALSAHAEESAQHNSTSAFEKEHAADPREVTRYIQRYSRGNDDPYENREGVYETAKMDFVVVVAQDKDSLEFWLELKPTLSTSEIKGARSGSNYGAREIARSRFHHYNAEEKRVLLERGAETKREKLQGELKALRKSIASLNSEIEFLSKLEEPEDPEQHQLTLERDKEQLQYLEGAQKKIEKQLAGDLKLGLPEYSGIRRELDIRPEFVPFVFADEKFLEELRAGKNVDPTGQELKAVLYLGKHPTPTRASLFEGNVQLMPDTRNNSQQTVAWKVEVADGKVAQAVATPSDRGPIKIWRRIGSTRINPDRSVDTITSDRLEQPFRDKPRPQSTLVPKSE
jgi:hypothetical protein